MKINHWEWVWNFALGGLISTFMLSPAVDFLSLKWIVGIVMLFAVVVAARDVVILHKETRQ